MIRFFRKIFGSGKVYPPFAKGYYYRLIKATALISILPMIAISILVVYGKLSLAEGCFAACAIFLGSIFFAKPYLADLSALTHYVQQLALDRKAEAPPLSFLSNVEELSNTVRHLHARWGERKIQIESALAESSVLFDILPDVLLMLDEDLTIIRANDRAYHVFGSDILHQNLKTIISDRKLPKRIHHVIHTGKGCVIEINATHDDIKYDFRTSIKKFPIYSLGGIAAVLVLHDITESKRTKQMMKDFVANASHEIRTPLTSVIGFIEMLQTAAKDDPEAQKKFLTIMEQQAKHMAMLVNDLLCLSKAEMKEHTPPRHTMDVYPAINSAIKNIEWQASQKNMKIMLKHKQNLPPIIGDTNEITQIMVNLLTNAVKYGYEKTPITIETGILKQSGKKTRITVSVQNQGEGIQPEDIARITQRFYRIDRVRSKNIVGAGLGLAIVKHILNRHKGDMVVESKPEQGSKFTIRIPIANKQQLLKAEAQATSDKKKPTT